MVCYFKHTRGRLKCQQFISLCGSQSQNQICSNATFSNTSKSYIFISIKQMLPGVYRKLFVSKFNHHMLLQCPIKWAYWENVSNFWGGNDSSLCFGQIMVIGHNVHQELECIILEQIKVWFNYDDILDTSIMIRRRSKKPWNVRKAKNDTSKSVCRRNKEGKRKKIEKRLLTGFVDKHFSGLLKWKV